ncbi:hypothetical protein HNP84_001052 [Thermocatellispora tengchongensis]|uniref:DUF4235 domain-containing protein n=1 Tax=Thermocatellispora tengchongensis TaxID=1073253 RepID=A0A840NYR4_9ACTN|nr:DUF4235 domain-containing protein [Thermocatellispora tengchongensis]MBB5131346.1 hypothetical protein [Thermocatellispora tengchongensis]
MAPVQKAVSLVLSLLSGMLAAALFKRAWKLVSGEDDAPDADDRDHGWVEVLVAATLQGAIFGLVKAAVHRAGAQAVRRTGGRRGKG